MQIVIDTAKTKITVKNKCFYIVAGKLKRQISPKRVSSIAITSNALINASAMILAAENQVPIYYFDRIGQIKAKVWSPYFKGLASLRRKQLLLSNSNFACEFSIDNMLLKLEMQKKLINKLAHWHRKEIEVMGYMKRYHIAETALMELKSQKETIEKVRHRILGIEGSLASNYWKTINLFLPEQCKFNKRSRRPARDSFNASINYLYGMAYRQVEQGVFACGLDPHIGFMHTENYRKVSLVFDLIEPFRPYIDELNVALFSNEKLYNSLFQNSKDGVLVGKEAKKVLIPKFNELLQERVKFKNKVRKLRDHIFTYSSSLADKIKKAII